MAQPLAGVLDAAPTPLLMLDPQGTLLYANVAARPALELLDIREGQPDLIGLLAGRSAGTDAEAAWRHLLGSGRVELRIGVGVAGHSPPRAAGELVFELTRPRADSGILAAIVHGDNDLAAQRRRRRQQTWLTQLPPDVEGGRFTWFPSTGLTQLSTSIYSLFGLDPSAGPPTLSELGVIVHPDDLAGLERAVDRGLGAGVFRVDYRVLLPDGRIRRVRTRGQVEYDEVGRPLCVYGIAFDLTPLDESGGALARLRHRIRHGDPRDLLVSWRWHRAQAQLEVLEGSLAERLAAADPMLGRETLLALIEPSHRHRVRALWQQVLQAATREVLVVPLASADEAGGGLAELVLSARRRPEGEILGVEGELRRPASGTLLADALVRAEAAMRRAEQLGRVGTWAWDVAEGELTWSEELYELFQRDPSEGPLPLRDYASVYRPEDVARLEQSVALALESALPFELELSLPRRGGDDRTCLLLAFPERGAGGQVTHLHGSLRDITWEHLAARELAASEARFRAFMQYLPAAVAVRDTRGVIVYANPRALAASGRAEEDVVGRTAEEVFGRELGTRVRALDRTAVASGEMQAEQVRLTDPRSRRAMWVENLVFPIEGGPGGEPLVGSIVLDLTARKAGEAERERLLSAIEQVDAMIVITDAEGTIEYVNPAFEWLTGYSAAEVLGGTAAAIQERMGDPGQYRELWRCVAAGESWRGLLSGHRRDGRPLQFSASVTPVRDERGGVASLVGIGRDVTEELVRQEQLRQSQKMDAIGRLAGGLAHDLNNMLQSVLLTVEEALTGNGLPPWLRDDLEVIRTGARRSADLTLKLLGFARRQPRAPVRLDVNDRLAEMIRVLERSLGDQVVVVFRPGQGLAPVQFDPVQLDQILSNLCMNAADALHGVGTIEVATWNAKENETPGVVLAVRDEGEGILPEHLEQIFEPFFTTREQGRGTGLGLSTVHGIVEQNGGRIEVDSTVGGGTEFRIHLPAVPAEVRDRRDAGLAGAVPAETPSPPMPCLRVLLVEDDERVGPLLARRLRGEGLEVQLAADPETAAAVFEAAPDEFDLLLSDVSLPGMSGLELVEVLRRRRANLAALLISGWSPDTLALDADPGQRTDFLQKPFEWPDLLDRLRRLGSTDEADG